MNRAVVPADLDALVAAVGAALDGEGAPVAPVPLLDRPGRADVPPGAALVLRTSGSTGAPREVVLSATALRASGAATHDRLGGPGHWLLTLPPTHVAGVQVVARAHAAGRGLTVAPPDEPFTPAGFAALVGRTPPTERRYVSLVPTQLHRLLVAADAGSDGGTAGLDALCALDAVLLGGAATPPALLRRARAAGARVVTTYGMTETSGGCVYDGVPLAGVRVRLGAGQEGTDASGGAAGVVELAGPVLADGYLGDPGATGHAFRTDDDGTRWFRTSDLGRLDGPPDDPTLTVLGRADDVVVSGGVNVAPAAVEALVVEVEGVGEACVVGVPHPEWGQEVVAVVTTAGRPPAPWTADGAHPDGGVADAPASLLAAVRDHVADRLERAAAPRRVLVVGELPRRGPGKVDRAAVARLAVGHLQVPPG